MSFKIVQYGCKVLASALRKSIRLLAGISILLAPAYSGQGGSPASSASNATVKVAAIQFISTFGEPATNRRGLETLIREAAGDGAKIIVLPETAISGYTSADLGTTWQVGRRPLSDGLKGTPPGDTAETVPGESTAAFCRLAGELGIYLSVPLVEADPKTGRYFNTVVLAGPSGEMLLHYRKLNPWMWAERGWATKGDHGLQYVDTPFGRLGLLICYDINFEPEHLKEAGIDTLLYSIAWVDQPNSAWFKKNLPDIARKNNFNIVGANWSVSKTHAWNGYGHSLVIDRTGTVLAKTTNDLGNAIIYSELPLPQTHPNKNSSK